MLDTLLALQILEPLGLADRLAEWGLLTEEFINGDRASTQGIDAGQCIIRLFIAVLDRFGFGLFWPQWLHWLQRLNGAATCTPLG